MCTVRWHRGGDGGRNKYMARNDCPSCKNEVEGAVCEKCGLDLTKDERSAGPCSADETLRSFISRNGPLPFAECVIMLKPLYEKVTQMHEKGLVHGCIGPDSIVVREDGGICLLGPDGSEHTGGTASVPSQSGSSPPERYSGNNMGAWTDVYSICATIYYCVTGETPPNAVDRFQGEDIHWDMVRTIPEGSKEVLKRGLSINIQERIGSVPELLCGLEGRTDAYSSGGVPAGDGTMWIGPDELNDNVYSTATDIYEDKRGDPRKRKKLWKISIGVLLVLLLLGGALLLFKTVQGNTDDEELSAAEDETESGGEDENSDEDDASETGDADSDETETESGEDSAEDPSENAEDDDTSQESTDIALNYTEYELPLGTTVALEVANAAGREITWSSSGAKTASVDVNGVVTAEAIGTATITATAEDGKTASCAITVPGVVAVGLDTESLLLKVGETHTFTVTLEKIGSPEPEITVNSSDRTVASAEGMEVTANQPGRVILTFLAGGASKTCEVTVISADT